MIDKARILLQLTSIRYQLDALAMEFQDEEPKATQCCASPQPVHEQSYGGDAWHCGNCGTELPGANGAGAAKRD